MEDVHRRYLNTNCSETEEGTLLSLSLSLLTLTNHHSNTTTTTDLTYLGVVLNCIGSICINLGTNVIKYGHIVANVNESSSPKKVGKPIRQPSKLERKISEQAKFEVRYTTLYNVKLINY